MGRVYSKRNGRIHLNTYAFSSRTVIITCNFVTYTKTLAVHKLV